LPSTGDSPGSSLIAARRACGAAVISAMTAIILRLVIGTFVFSDD
jgi:hypothetical protein